MKAFLATLLLITAISSQGLADGNNEYAIELNEAEAGQTLTHSTTENLNYVLQEQAPPIITQKRGEDTYFELRSLEERDPSSAL